MVGVVGSNGEEMSVVVVESFAGRGGGEMVGLKPDLGGRLGGWRLRLFWLGLEGSKLGMPWVSGTVGYEYAASKSLRCEDCAMGLPGRSIAALTS